MIQIPFPRAMLLTTAMFLSGTATATESCPAFLNHDFKKLRSSQSIWSSQDFVDTLERLEKRAEEVSNVQESHPLGYPKDLRVHFCASQVL